MLDRHMLDKNKDMKRGESSVIEEIMQRTPGCRRDTARKTCQTLLQELVTVENMLVSSAKLKIVNDIEDCVKDTRRQNMRFTYASK